MWRMACNLIGNLIGNLTCEMQARADNTGTISTNASVRCATKPCYLCGGPEWMCQHVCTWRGQMCSRVDHSKVVLTLMSLWEWLGWHVCKMWEHWGWSASVQKMPSWNVIILGHVKCGQGQKGPELFLSNPTWRFVARLCHFSVDTECMCQHTCTQRGQVYSQNFPRTQCGSMWFS
jgi:hypothetical protein